MVERVTPSPADLAAIVEYLDGNLDEEAMLAFEERLELEPELARALEEFEAVDRVQRESVAPRTAAAILGELAQAERASRRRILVFGLSLAAAFLALVSAAAWFFGKGAPRPALAFELAALGIAEASPESVNRSLGLDESWLPSRMRAGRGPDEPEPPSESEYLHGALTAQETRASGALAAGSDGIHAGRFTLVLRPEQDAWTVVVVVPRSGRPERLFPVEGDPGSIGPLRAGVLTLLPKAFVAQESVADGSPRAGFDYGFLVPRGAGDLRVLTGLRADAIPQELLAELDRRLVAGTGSSPEMAQSLADWLKERGFSVGETIVIE